MPKGPQRCPFLLPPSLWRCGRWGSSGRPRAHRRGSCLPPPRPPPSRLPRRLSSQDTANAPLWTDRAPRRPRSSRSRKARLDSIDATNSARFWRHTQVGAAAPRRAGPLVRTATAETRAGPQTSVRLGHACPPLALRSTVVACFSVAQPPEVRNAASPSASIRRRSLSINGLGEPISPMAPADARRPLHADHSQRRACDLTPVGGRCELQAPPVADTTASHSTVFG